MTQRRELIHELTQVAWGTLHQYHEKEKTGEFNRKQAQKLAIDHLRNLRYGSESKDYFWINDMHPTMIMHPYRPELEGEDISTFADPNGKRLFIEFIKVVDKNNAGYVAYEWQWKDDPTRIVPKISFVKGFSPWNWIVGTGIYIDDIQKEISTITKQLTVTCFGILLFISILSGTIIWQSVKVERERIQAERNAKLQQEQLYQASKMATVGTLAAGIAHEINNPITTILLNIPIVKEMWSSITPLVKHYAAGNDCLHVRAMDFSELCKVTPQLLDHIDDGARRISNIVSELKDFSRLSPPERNNDVAINSAVEKSIALVHNLITDTTEHFYSDCQSNLPFFKGNLLKVEQVIVNLLINACQALQNKNQMIKISTGFDENSQSVTVSVEDSGSGIPPELLERIKDPFFTTKQRNGSTGLGLAISDRIMKDHNGKIVFTSSPEKGTRAVLYFPVCKKENI